MDFNGANTGAEDNQIPVNLPHHLQQELCSTRAPYRQGKKLTAVKVYTVNSESQHLLIYRVPAINLKNELLALCQKFGELSTLCKLELLEPEEEFTEIYHVRYNQIYKARVAKRQMDGRSFYGSLLHVCYAPELETVDETRLKLIHRRSEIAHLTGRKRKLSNFTLKGMHQSAQERALKGHFNNKRLKLDSPNKFNAEFQPNEESNLPSSLNYNNASSFLTPSGGGSLQQEAHTANFPSSSTDTFPVGPYDQPCSYESQQVLQLPGREVAVCRVKKFTPTSVIKRSTATKTNKIVFHRRTEV